MESKTPGRKYGELTKEGKLLCAEKTRNLLSAVRTRAGKCLRTTPISVQKICQRDVLHLLGALEILVE